MVAVTGAPVNPMGFYFGACAGGVWKTNLAFRSRDLGISPDLTRHDPTTLELSGRPTTRDTSGAEVCATRFAFVESPYAAGGLTGRL